MHKAIYRSWVLFLLVVAFFLYQGTRQIVGAALPQIQAAFQVSKPELGAVVTLFALLYGICVPLAGIAGDIFRRKWLILAGVGVFSFGIFLSGLTCGVGGLLISYGVLTNKTRQRIDRAVIR